jgi:hypothetical protein
MVKNMKKNYQPKSVKDVTNVGYKMYDSSMAAIGSRYSDFLTKYPEFYNVAYSVNKYTITQDFLISLTDGLDRGDARFKGAIWQEYAKLLQRMTDRMGYVLWSGTDKAGLDWLELTLYPMLGVKIGLLKDTKLKGYMVVAPDKRIKANEKEVYDRYVDTIRELVAQYAGKKVKQELKCDLSAKPAASDEEATTTDDNGEATSINSVE